MVIDLSKMLVMEDNVILDKSVFKLSFFEKKVLVTRVVYSVTSSVVVAFCDGKLILP
jgi:hypothetical protein